MNPDLLDPAQKEYKDTFSEPLTSPEMSAFDKELDNLYGDGFNYTGDTEKHDVAAQESSSALAASKADHAEMSKLPGGMPKKPQTLLNRAKGLLSSKKKLAVAGVLAGGGGLIIAALFFFMLFAGGFSLKQFSTVLQTAAFGRMHLANYRRSSQYLVEESLNDAVVNGEGRVNSLGKPSVIDRLNSYNADEMFTNAGEKGAFKMNYVDEETGWIRKSTTAKLESITIGDKEIPIPEKSRLNFVKRYRENKAFMNNVDEAVNEVGLFAEETRYARTSFADDTFKLTKIKLFRWQESGRKIKTFKDGVLSAYDRLKGNGVKSNISEVNNAADNYDGELATALESTDDVERAGVIASTQSVKKASSVVTEVAGKASLAALVATLYCGARDYVGNAAEIAQKKGETAMQSGALLESTVAQAEAGATTATAVDIEAKRHEDGETSYIYQKNVGVPAATLANKAPDLDGSDLPVVDSSSPVYRFFNVIYATGNGALGGDTPGVKGVSNAAQEKICSAVTSPAGQVAIVIGEVILTAVASALTGGGAAGGEVAAKEGVEVATEQALSFSTKAFVKTFTKEGIKQGGMALGLYFVFSSLSGTNTPATQSGRHLVGTEGLGDTMLGNQGAGAIGGRPLSASENAGVQSIITERRIAKLHSQPLFYRLASLSNPYSPASQFATTYPSNPARMLSKVKTFASSSLNPVATIGQNYSRFASAAITSKDFVYAASDDSDVLKTAGLKPIGYSAAELEKMTQPDFWPRANATYVEQGDRLKAMHDSYQSCFDDLQAKNKMDSSCDEKLKTDDALHYRLYKMDGGLSDAPIGGTDKNDGLLGQLIDLQKVTADTSSSGSTPTGTGSTTGDIGVSSANIPCAPGTNDLGTVDSKYTGSARKSNPLTIHLCQVPDIPGGGENAAGVKVTGGAVVNARVSDAWAALARAAKGAGKNLTASSSFRLNDSCGGTGTGTACAKPGSSMHQLGVAIDFANMGTKGGSTSTCSQRKGLTRGAAGYDNWQWLFDNAEKFGFKQYSYEPWHWDNAFTVGVTSRCDSSQPATVF